MFKLRIETVPHKEQAYETLGDYGFDVDGGMWIKVSDLGDWRYEFLIAIHEAIEFSLLKARGIEDPGKYTEAFDVIWEERLRFDDIGKLVDEPGFDPRSPYIIDHTIADLVEHALLGKLGVDPMKYDEAMESVYHQDEGGGC